MFGSRSKIAKLDWYVIVPSLYLLVLGLVIQSSIANKTTGIPIEINMATHVAAIIGAVGAVVFFWVFRILQKSATSNLIYFVSLGLLVAVLLVGFEANGSQRWISLGSIQLQPTELAKLGLVFLLAKLFDNRDATVNHLRTLIMSLLAVGVPGVLILLQPDLGSAVVLFVVWITILFASRLKLSRFTLVMLAIIGGVITLVPFMAEYQQERLVSYFNPERDTSGSSYNVLQAGIAIGSGGLTGNGIDSGSQSQLNFLPSQHTDFVFAVTAEKLGLIGAMSIIAAFALIILRISYLAWWTSNQFERGLLVGIAALLFFHVFVNIGMNLGLVPVTGLPLPLLSYGGTFMFVTILALGVVAIISYNIKRRVQNTI